MKKWFILCCFSCLFLLISCKENSAMTTPPTVGDNYEESVPLGLKVEIYENQDTYNMYYDEWLYTFTDKSDQSCTLSKDKTYIMTIGYISATDVQRITIGDNCFVYDTNRLEIKSIYQIVKEEHKPVYTGGYKIRNISGDSEATLGVYMKPYLVKIKFKFV